MKQETAMRWLTVYAGTLTAAVGVFLLSGAAAPGKHARFEEIDVQRINVREPDGTLRLVVSNKSRFPGAIFKGREYPHPRGTAGMLFYNDEGTETGGLSYAGSKSADGKVKSGVHLSFDPYEQDQTVVLENAESGGQRVGYLKFNDVPDVSLQPLLDNIEELRKLPPAGQQKRATELLGGKPPMVQRLFVGSGLDKESGVKLMDAAGKPRLELKVTADGRASIEFLDGDGKVVRRLSPDEVCAQ